MSLTVCLSPGTTLRALNLGGHLWVYLNWALGLRALGCRVIWLDQSRSNVPVEKIQRNISTLKGYLQHFGLAESLAVYSSDGAPLPRGATEGCLDLDAASESDLLINLGYSKRPEVIARFRKSALLDIDPGLLQSWLSGGRINVARHDIYFTIGETVGQPGSKVADAGLKWHYTPPCVALDYWPIREAPETAPFTTVSNWSGDEWMEDANGIYKNDKQAGFLPFMDLPRFSSQPLELALCLSKNEEEKERLALQEHGWQVRHSYEVSGTPQDYQNYIQNSRGEFSAVKPSCIRLQNAWISDRTLCYLASGKPAVVQHTGPSRFLPDEAGLFRFHNLEDAARYLKEAASNYKHHCQLARSLVEEYFDARKVVKSVLERALS